MTWESDWYENLASVRVPPPPKPREPGWIIGRDCEDGGDLIIPYKELFETHVHCMGPSGWGKTFLLYNLIAQTILAGHGCVVIDPDGGLYHMVLNFLIQQRISPKRVLLINTNQSQTVVKLNPLQIWEESPSLGKDIAAGALLRAAGQYNFDHTPRLRKYLRAASSAMIKAQLPMALMPWFCALAPASAALRGRVTGVEANPYLQLVWQEFESLTPSHKQEHLDSTVNRVTAFAEDERLCRMMTYTQGNVDWKEDLNAGSIVLCNLSQDGAEPLGKEDLRMLGSLVIHGVAEAAYRRDLNERRHCFCFVDEFGDFVSEDVAQGLNRLRKRKVHYVLAHQSIAQIEEESPRLYKAMTTNCQVKLIFGGLDREDTERVAKDLYTGQVHANDVKHEVSTIAFRPLIEWIELKTETDGGSSGVTESFTRTETDSESEGVTESSSEGSSTTVLYAADSGVVSWDETGRSETMSFQEAVSTSKARSHSSSESHTVSYSQGVNWSTSVGEVPVTVYEEFAQPPQLTFYTLEEKWEEVYGLLMNLPKRTVVVKRPAKPAVIVPTLAIKERLAPKEALDRYEQLVFQLCPYTAADREAQQVFLTALAESGFAEEHVDEPDDYGVEDGIVGDIPTPPSG